MRYFSSTEVDLLSIHNATNVSLPFLTFNSYVVQRTDRCNIMTKLKSQSPVLPVIESYTKKIL